MIPSPVITAQHLAIVANPVSIDPNVHLDQPFPYYLGVDAGVIVQNTPQNRNHMEIKSGCRPLEPGPMRMWRIGYPEVWGFTDMAQFYAV